MLPTLPAALCQRVSLNKCKYMEKICQRDGNGKCADSLIHSCDSGYLTAISFGSLSLNFKRSDWCQAALVFECFECEWHTCMNPPAKKLNTAFNSLRPMSSCNIYQWNMWFGGNHNFSTFPVSTLTIFTLGCIIINQLDTWWATESSLDLDLTKPSPWGPHESFAKTVPSPSTPVPYRPPE